MSEAETRGKLEELIVIGEKIFETYRNQVIHEDQWVVEVGRR